MGGGWLYTRIASKFRYPRRATMVRASSRTGYYVTTARTEHRGQRTQQHGEVKSVVVTALPPTLPSQRRSRSILYLQILVNSAQPIDIRICSIFKRVHARIEPKVSLCLGHTGPLATGWEQPCAGLANTLPISQTTPRAGLDH